MKRTGLGWLLAVLLGVLLAFLGFWSAGAILALPSSNPQRADAVVMLGGGDGARYARARELVLAGFAPRLVLIDPTAAELADAKTRFPDATVWKDVLPGNSWGEAKTTHNRMQANGWKSVLVVTDPPHMLRVRYAWASNFFGSDLHFVLVAANPTWWSTWRWWQNPQSAQFVKEEILKLGYYVVRYQFGFFE